MIEGFELKEKISSNDHFDVYRAQHVQNKIAAAIKIPNSEYPLAEDIALLHHEYKLLKGLHNRGIVHPIKLAHKQQVAALILENIEGVSLKTYLQQNRFDLETFFHLAIQLVDIIGKLHENHIIYKSLNSRTIFISNLSLKLIDFSLSTQLTEETQGYLGATSHYNFISAYSAPEQTGRINRSIDYRTDFYSLGVVFFEMLTGSLPFQAEDRLELIHYIIAKSAPLVTDYNSSIPAVLASIIAKLLSKMSEDRYASIIGLKQDLLRCSEEWRRTHQINRFVLGQKDVNDHLNISHRLYGRKRQVESLLSTFNKVSEGASKLVLISGYSGVGKTSLVKEVHKPIVEQKGYFIQGKYDQLQSYVPFSAIVNAFKELVNQILAESEEKLFKIKEELLKKMENMGQIIINIIPEVELIIGKQPPAPKLTSAETQNRFNLIFQKFIQVFAKKEHPIVIFLDDLQWADTASLKFLENLFENHETNYLLVLGAYRNNEVDSTHPLMITLRSLKKSKVEFKNIILQPLKLRSIQKLLVDTFNVSSEEVKDLALLLEEKTQGNPFFINIFIKTIHQENILFFSYELGHWSWDIEKIKHQTATDNVVDLLTVRILKLLPNTQEILKLAASFGHQFKIKELSIVSSQPIYITARQIWEAIQNNLIINLDEIYKTTALLERGSEDNLREDFNLTYRFAHDRIQQAAYQLIPLDDRRQLHLTIGRLLLKEKPLTKQDDRLFEIMEHFNEGKELITDKNEKQKLAEYNLWAGEKAKTSTAYQAAKEYLQSGIQLVNRYDWENNYLLLYSLFKELAVCKYLTGEFDEANEYFGLLIDNSKNIIDKIEIFRLNCEMLSTLNKHAEAIDLGLRALSLLGIKLSTKPSDLKILLTVFKIKRKIKNQDIKNIQLLPINNEEKKAAIDLITQLLNNAFIINQKLFVLLTCTNIYLSLKYGYTESNAMSIPVYAFVLIHALNMYPEGLDFIELDKALKLKYGLSKFEGRNQFILGAFIEPWRSNIENCYNILVHAFQLTRNTGDLVYAHYCNLLLVNTSFFTGKSLTETKRYLQDTIAFVLKSKINDFSRVVSFWDYILQCLELNKSFELKEVYKYEKEVLANKSNTEKCFFYSYATKICYLFGHHEEALKFGLAYFEVYEYGLGMVNNVEFLVYFALSITAEFSKFSFVKQMRYKRILGKLEKKLKRWTAWCPVNFEYYLLLLEAEIAFINGRYNLATILYDQAIEKANKENANFVAAIANECAGKNFIKQKLSRLAKYYFLESYALFREFGAISKCKQLQDIYEDYFIVADNFPPIEIDMIKTSQKSIDMLAILKSAEIIASEIHLDRLRKKLLLVLLEVAGAEHGVILFKKSSKWLVEADGNIEQQKIYLNHEEEANENNLPLSLLNYVQRTLQPYIVQEATHSDITILDPYVQKIKPKSLLMFPILYQGQLSRIFYLENKTSTHSFTKKNLQSLQLIASSAMISLENARLYHQASHDPLTGLANRNLLDQIFKVSASQALRTKTQLVFFFLDLDNFKTINDTLGHEIGDKLLIHVTKKITQCLREGDLAARLGGDEFAILLAGVEGISQISAVADRLLESIREPVIILGHQVQITTSMGICIFPKDAPDINTLLKSADIALYQAKEFGKNQYYFYSENLQEEYRKIHLQETELQRAIENKEFRIFYQPILDITQNEVVSLEALIRWQHPQKGLLAAKEFINILEKKTLVLPVSEWIIHHICQQAKKWQKNGLLNIPIAINTSAVQLGSSRSISKLIADALRNNQLEPSTIQLELTESTFIESNNKVNEEIHSLLGLGIKLVIDDFGTGYSSLSYLRRLPVSKIKIDQSFFQKNSDDEFDRVIIGAITTLAHQLNLEVIAEGIENQKQLEIARSLKIDAIQGYFYSYPLSAEDCETFLRKIQKSTKIEKKVYRNSRL